MRAVNLIPAEERRGGGGAAGRSGGAVFVLLGALALVVAMSIVHTTTGRAVGERRTELAAVRAQATLAQRAAGDLGDFTAYATLAKARIDTVSQLAGSRFDWATALEGVARVTPGDINLTSLVGTVAPTVTVQGAGGSTGSLRSALPVPALELAGCAPSQTRVARYLARLRLIDGVQRVSLAQSAKPDTGGSGGQGGRCADSDARQPQFSLVVFFGGAR